MNRKNGYLLLVFPDLLGNLKGRVVPASRLEEVCERGIGFDGSSIPGYVSIEKSDMCMKLDRETLSPLPEYFYGRPTEIGICDIYKPDGKEFEGSPRSICKRIVNNLRNQGYEPISAVEVEFYVITQKDGKWVPVEHHVKEEQRYFDISFDRDLTEEFRMELCDVLTDMGFEIEREQHEVGHSQNEITFKYDDPVTISDLTLKYKHAAKGVAHKFGWKVTFMPKPWPEMAGNGMHVHVNLKSGEKNLFYDPEDEYVNLSQLGRYFIGGLLEHARALAAIVAPTVNSYLRLTSGFEAPVYIAWSKQNRSALVRIPKYFPDNNNVRVEFRVPDPLCNPYLAFSCIFKAGLDGIRKSIDPGDPVDKNLYNLSGAERKKLGIETLPGSLKEALEEWKSDDICVRALGKEVAEKYLELKLKEWNDYDKAPDKRAWELERYLFA